MKGMAAAACAGLIAAAGGIPVAAQDIVFDPGPSVTCMAQSDGDWAHCAGTSANLCMQESLHGWTTVGMMNCLGAELDYWDRRLNIAYQKARSMARQADLDAPEGVASQADALQAMQRAWITFRDRQCAYMQSQWGGGTGGGPVAVGCHMGETAEQTHFLETIGLGL
ncbi:MAG: lysozyme inhibitor LprI family protein [Paracoccaceae bacterium]